ncbi:hypothetical protein FO519_001991 [Halicephalobus sp. NKZ332]|nr:hypothetical protein FO519_001991 [Halicephalobus sp. NKZ332]
MTWFESFREDGAPTYFYRNISEPLSINIRTLIIFFLFLVPYLAFIIILPGMREKRFSSFFTITYHLGIGCLLMASLVLPYWNVGSVRIVSQFTPDGVQHEADLGISVGLKAINVSLKYIRSFNSDPERFKGMYFNEKYTMDGVNAMGAELMEAYERGMPYPFLKVLEYFSLNAGSFCWGREYRKAGYFTDALLWTAVAFWALQTVLLLSLPHQYAKAGLLTGCFILLGVLLYIILAPEQLHIPFVGVNGQKVYLVMHYGSSFYLAIISGILSVVFSFIFCVLQYFRIYTLDTIFGSNLDDTVGPKCKWGSKIGEDRYLSSACSDISTYISEEGRSTPPYKDLKKDDKYSTPYHETNPKKEDEKIINHQKRISNDSVGSAAWNKSTTDLTSLDSSGHRSLGSTDRVDSIGTIDHLDDIDNSPGFAKRNFTLPLR